MTARLPRLALVALLASLAACKEEQQTSIEPAVRPVLSVVAVVRTVDTLGPFAGTIERWSYAPPDDTTRAAAEIRRRLATRLDAVA